MFFEGTAAHKPVKRMDKLSKTDPKLGRKSLKISGEIYSCFTMLNWAGQGRTELQEGHIGRHSGAVWRSRSIKKDVQNDIIKSTPKNYGKFIEKNM